MPYFSKTEMKKELDNNTFYQTFLYCRGFLLSTNGNINCKDYPFYNNWSKREITKGYYIYIHRDNAFYSTNNGDVTHFLIGHAYDPYNNIVSENEILNHLADSLIISQDDYWKEESNLTGVFCIGYISNDELVYAVDCCGMQIVYYSIIKGNLYLTSHSKLVADLFDIKQDTYIEKLVSRRLFKYYGRWLPGDLSPYKELKRTQPNFYVIYHPERELLEYKRFYPTKKIQEVKSHQEYKEKIHELGDIIANSLDLIARKWPDRRIAMSVTGGKDSMTTLSCANGKYDKFMYFSYTSNHPEEVDAVAASKICKAVGVPHSIYRIPKDGKEYENLELFRKILMCNQGCIRMNNLNDAKKRLYFCLHPKFDIEIKSWVNEMGRGWYYNKYQKKDFPRRPNAKYWRTMHKVYIEPNIIRETTKIFSDYLKKYYSEDVFSMLSWVDLYFWEFSWSGLEGLALTSEHKISYDITIPYNNRRLVETMLMLPLDKRISDQIPKDIIKERNAVITDTGISIKDIEHTNNRARLDRVYLEVFSKI